MRGLYAAKEARFKVDQRISIGQGFRGKAVEGIGIGNCCIGAGYCVKGCPPTAADVGKMLRALS